MRQHEDEISIARLNEVKADCPFIA